MVEEKGEGGGEKEEKKKTPPSTPPAGAGRASCRRRPLSPLCHRRRQRLCGSLCEPAGHNTPTTRRPAHAFAFAFAAFAATAFAAAAAAAAGGLRHGTAAAAPPPLAVHLPLLRPTLLQLPLCTAGKRGGKGPGAGG